MRTEALREEERAGGWGGGGELRVEVNSDRVGGLEGLRVEGTACGRRNSWRRASWRNQQGLGEGRRGRPGVSPALSCL